VKYLILLRIAANQTLRAIVSVILQCENRTNKCGKILVKLINAIIKKTNNLKLGLLLSAPEEEINFNLLFLNKEVLNFVIGANKIKPDK